ncbi:MAG: rod shape-determining protein MreC [Clostridia bacterium]|nr:rod shape-determining protein MreC [Clostridia bacterium]
MKLFKNKFFVICLCVAVVICAVPSTFALMGYRGLARNIVGTLTVPFRWCGTVIGNAFEGFGKYFGSVDALRAENEALESENQALRDQLEEAELMEAENERLRQYLEMKNQYPSFLMEEGMIISYSAGNYMTSFTLNRGSLHGIEVNMPVVVTEGIVGYVTDVGLNWCMVSTIIETASSVGAYIPRSGATGIVSGDSSLRNEGVCKISYMESNADIQVGDKVMSSGTGSVYPADLPIGEIISVEIDEYSRSLVATVKPMVDFTNLKYMMIITGYQN